MKIPQKMKKEAERITTLYKAMERYAQPEHKKWTRFREAYLREQKRAAEDGRSNLFYPLIYRIVEAMVPRVLNVMFGPDAPVKNRPVNGEDAIKAMVCDELLARRFKQPSIQLSQIKSIKNCVKYGLGVTKLGWLMQEGVRTQRVQRNVINEFTGEMMTDEETGMPLTTWELEDVPRLEKYCPHAEGIPPIDILLDHQSRDITYQAMRRLNHRFEKDYDEIMALTESNGGPYDDRAVKMIKETARPNIPESKRAFEEAKGRESDIQADIERPVEIFEFWEKDVNTNIWYVTTIANRQVIIRPRSRCPFWFNHPPFVFYPNVIDEGYLYPIGDIEAIEDLQHEWNTRRNQRLDNINLVLSPGYQIRYGSQVDLDALSNPRPGFFVYVNDVQNDLAPFQWQDVTASTYKEEAVIHADVQNITGLHDPFIGAPSARRETATGLVSLQRAAGERVKFKIAALEIFGLIELAKMLLELDRQKMTINDIFELVQPANATIEQLGQTMDDLVIDRDLEPQGSLLMEARDIEKKNAIAMTQIVGRPPYMQMVNHHKWLQHLFRLFEVRNIDEFLFQYGSEGYQQNVNAFMQLGGTGGPPPRPEGLMAGAPGGGPGTPSPEAGGMAQMLQQMAYPGGFGG